MSEENFVFDWDSEIEKDGEFTVLPAGDYDFEVTDFERGRYPGGEKMPPCPQATLTIRLDGKELGKSTVTYRLYLLSKMEWKLSEFFVSIGQKKKGEKVAMNWNNVKGSTGRCKVAVRKYTDKNGNEQESNEIKSFYEKQMTGASGSGWGSWS